MQMRDLYSFSEECSKEKRAEVGEEGSSGGATSREVPRSERRPFEDYQQRRRRHSHRRKRNAEGSPDLEIEGFDIYFVKKRHLGTFVR